MNIEKEYKLLLDDYLNFQQHQLKINARSNFWYNLLQLLMACLPMFYIIFSIFFIIDFIVKTIGLIIALCLLVYYLLISIFSERINKNFLKNIHYKKNDISINVKIKITENSITEYCQYSESIVLEQWVYEYQENKNYIYLMSIYKAGIILPKIYFSEEEIEVIKKYYKK